MGCRVRHLGVTTKGKEFGFPKFRALLVVGTCNKDDNM